MIIDFSIQNFGPIKDEITLSFEASNDEYLQDYYVIEPKKGLRLLKLGLIYGANASGKTTILKALSTLHELMLRPLRRKSMNIIFMPFRLDNENQNKPTIFKLNFIQNKIHYSLEIKYTNEAVVFEELYFYNPNRELIFRRNTNIEKQLSLIEFGEKIEINEGQKNVLEANTLWNNTVMGGYLKTNFESHEMQDVYNWFSSKLKNMILPVSSLSGFVSRKINRNEIDKKRVINLLKKADFNISDIVIKKQREEINNIRIEKIKNDLSIDNEEKQELINQISNEDLISDTVFRHELTNTNHFLLSFNEESSGTQRYYELAGILDIMINTESIFPVDEIESSLHPELLKHFLLSFLANSEQSQLIATTHNRELLLEREILRNDAVWFTEKKNDGSSDLFSLDDFNSSDIRTTSSVYDAYKIGKLGATPNLSDYYIDIDDGKEE